MTAPTAVRSATSARSRLGTRFVLLDAEYTAWEGSKERSWRGPGEHRELVELGAIRVDAASLVELDAFRCLLRPRINPVLSAYFTALTGITQADVDRNGVEIAEGIREFAAWLGNDPVFCFGSDGVVIEENLALCGRQDGSFSHVVHDIRQVFSEVGVDMTGYSSGTCSRAVGLEPKRSAHSGLNDVRTILEALQSALSRAGGASQETVI